VPHLVVETLSPYVDQRVRVAHVSAVPLTRDTVCVNVDRHRLLDGVECGEIHSPGRKFRDDQRKARKLRTSPSDATNSRR
jgi:hypothetical protein